ncbi:MAG: hypothetical protein LBP52_06685 [Burkholderiaceae bacterium]|jgi:hypothetical protein|nr:hypothetical protein [Burkholderiaceae bacterium]
MNSELRDDDAPAAHPLPPEREGSPTRWIVSAFAICLLALGGYKGVQWLGEHRDTLLPRPPQSAPVDAETALSPLPPQPDWPRPGAPQIGGAPGEPLAPAVAGDSIRQCVKDGQTIFTNQDCPPGSTPVPQNRGGAQTAASVLARPLASAGLDAAGRAAQCNYLLAESERLRFEFDQPLPPPVLDQISGHLKLLRDNSEALGCPQPAAPPKDKKSAAAN